MARYLVLLTGMMLPSLRCFPISVKLRDFGKMPWSKELHPLICENTEQEGIVVATNLIRVWEGRCAWQAFIT